MKKIKLLFTLLTLIGLTTLSCSSSDDSDNSCASYINQPVQGSFRGEDFISPAGFYKVLTFGQTTNIRGEIYVKENQDTDCFFPTFEGTQDNILFPIPSLEVQTINLSETGENTLNFNRIVQNVTEVELAECGTIEITSYDADNGILQGTVVAEGQFGSRVNGNFTLLLCDD